MNFDDFCRYAWIVACIGGLITLFIGLADNVKANTKKIVIVIGGAFTIVAALMQVRSDNIDTSKNQKQMDSISYLNGQNIQLSKVNSELIKLTGRKVDTANYSIEEINYIANIISRTTEHLSDLQTGGNTTVEVKLFSFATDSNHVMFLFFGRGENYLRNVTMYMRVLEPIYYPILDTFIKEFDRGSNSFIYIPSKSFSHTKPYEVHITMHTMEKRFVVKVKFQYVAGRWEYGSCTFETTAKSKKPKLIHRTISPGFPDKNYKPDGYNITL